MDLDELMLPIGGAAILAIAMFSGGPDALGTITGATGKDIKALQSESAIEQAITATNQGTAASRDAVAWERYSNGCNVHVKLAAVQRPEDVAIGGISVEYMPVVEGDVPRNLQTGGPYSRGTVLCDAWGNTALIDESGAATDAAYTGQNVQPAIAKYFDERWGG